MRLAAIDLQMVPDLLSRPPQTAGTIGASTIAEIQHPTTLCASHTRLRDRPFERIAKVHFRDAFARTPSVSTSSTNAVGPAGARLIGHERKAGETVLEGSFARNKRHGNPH